jgi:hypothetical protein
MNNCSFAFATAIILCSSAAWCGQGSADAPGTKQPRPIIPATNIVFTWEVLKYVAANEKIDASVRQCAETGKAQFINYALKEDFMLADGTLDIGINQDQIIDLIHSLMSQNSSNKFAPIIIDWSAEVNKKITENSNYKHATHRADITRKTLSKYVDLLSPLLWQEHLLRSTRNSSDL